MKVRTYFSYFGLILLLAILCGCSNKQETAGENTLSGQTQNDSKEVATFSPDAAGSYTFDVLANVEEEYNQKHDGISYTDFSDTYNAYKLYTYKTTDKELSIDKVALELGNVLMQDLSTEYDGKSFTVTQYQDLTAHILTSEELQLWAKGSYSSYQLTKDQWLCDFNCKIKYKGTISPIGEMPKDVEWYGLHTDGSDENQYFIIQKTDSNTYCMRTISKTGVVSPK